MIAEPMIEVTLRVANSLKEVAGEAWDACANPVSRATATGPPWRLGTSKKIH